MNININDVIIDRKSNSRYKIVDIIHSRYKSEDTIYAAKCLTDINPNTKNCTYPFHQSHIEYYEVDLDEKLYRLINNI
jgi:hypothetical protein